MLERHEQDAAGKSLHAREEMAFLTEKMELAEAKRQQRLAQLLPGGGKKEGKKAVIDKIDLWVWYVILVFGLWVCL